MSEPDDPYAAPDPNAAPSQGPGGPAPAPGQGGYGAPTYGAPAHGAPPGPGQYPPPPGGYGPPPGQGYPPPPPGQPGYGPPQGWYPAPQKTNGLAIASLICSCAAFVVCISAPVGAVLGFVALSQIKRTGEQGRGIALAGAWIGTVVTVLGVVAIAVFVAIAAWFVDDVDDACPRENFSSEQAYQDCLERQFDDRFNTNASGPAAVPVVFATAR